MEGRGFPGLGERLRGLAPFQDREVGRSGICRVCCRVVFSLSSADWGTTKGFGAEARGPAWAGLAAHPQRTPCALLCPALRVQLGGRIQTGSGQGPGAGLCWQNIWKTSGSGWELSPAVTWTSVAAEGRGKKSGAQRAASRGHGRGLCAGFLATLGQSSHLSPGAAPSTGEDTSQAAECPRKKCHHFPRSL